ncbi:AbrB/MazE/SpoVT family DNA-binding domain-containing protein [Vibrio cyclitrophicus]|uniref:AbrB/MazE/SpoVT family DNA-binding domain-containing protein n=1 Tax=Vibrio cyclitrophicus TaxID=47951 RepID=UPI001056841A|nr:AbrB/MazE/SpoVT family DNA-binding domain-containing protein [Vibrio cyclitrophicus]
MRVPIKVTEKGEHYVEIPDEYLEELDWREGDEITWTENKDGGFSLTKKGDTPHKHLF